MKMIYLKANLLNGGNSIWRTFEVSELISFEALHKILQVLFGYLDKEDYEFFSAAEKWRFTSDKDLIEKAKFLKSEAGKQYLATVDKEKYEVAVDIEIASASDRQIADYFAENKSIMYIYDFVDEWQVELTCLDRFEGSGETVFLDGFGSAPYESVGGLSGYLSIMETLSNPENPDYDELRLWLYEKGYTRFDKDEIREKLKLLKIF